MADQTQRLEIATVRAEVGSNILYRVANDPVAADPIPTESGDMPNLKQVIAEIQEEGAQKISVATTIYPSVEAGLAATTDGGIFLVQSEEAAEIYRVWKNDGSSAVNTGKTAMSSEAIEQALLASNEAAQAAEDAADVATNRTAGFLAPSATPPEIRDNGLPLQVGDRYFNTIEQAEYIYSSSGWAANESLEAVAQLHSLLSSDDGSDIIGFSQGGVNSIARTVRDKLKDVAKSPADYGGLQNAIDALAESGGGVIFAEGLFPPITLRTGVYVVGTPGKSIIEYLDDDIKHIVQSERFDELTGTNNYSDSTPHNFGIIDFIVRGGSKTTGSVNGISLYGYNYTYDGVVVTNVSGVGANLEWGQYGEAALGMETHYGNLRIDGAGEHGIRHKGPHDSCFNNAIVIDAGQKEDNVYHGFYSTGYGNSRSFNIHVWHRSAAVNRVSYSIYADGGCEFIACHAEGGRKQLYLGGNCVWSGGTLYAPQSSESQIVIDGAYNVVDARFTSANALLDPVLVEFGKLKRSERNRVKISASMGASATSKPLVMLTNEIGNCIEIIASGWKGQASGVTMYSGTLSYATELVINQNFPAKAFFRQLPQAGYSVRFDGYGQQAARLVSIPGAADLTYNCQLTNGLALSSQDDASLGYSGIASRADGIFGVVGTAGAAAKIVLNITTAGVVHLGGPTGGSSLQISSAGIGFYGKSPTAKPSVTGAKGSNAALASLISQLVALGLITDSTGA